MEDQPTTHQIQRDGARFSVLFAGIFILLLVILGVVLMPKDPRAGSKDQRVEGRAEEPRVVSNQPSLPPPAVLQHLRQLPVPPPQREARMTETSRPEALLSCRLIDEPGNDGDSFKVKTSQGVFRFCLYFVDTPDAVGGSSVASADQARYFGGLTEQELRAVAKDAEVFVKDLLKNRPFDVVTRWEPAPEESYSEEVAYRGFVYVPAREGSVNLSALLVQQGWATICRCQENPPSGITAGKFQHTLQSIEAEAIKKRVGAWRFAVNRMEAMTVPVHYVEP